MNYHIDIFDFWKNVEPGQKRHPADEEILSQPEFKKNLDLDCLPAPYYGPLKHASVVLLFLNPGLSDRDKLDAVDPDGQAFWHRQLQGEEFLRSQTAVNKKSWWVSVTKCFEVDTEILRERMAVLELCPYHSKDFTERYLLSALPSCRTSVSYAQNILFQDAREGRRVVICLRSPKYWGLVAGGKMGKSIFSPTTNRSGHMLTSEVLRSEVIKAVQHAVRARPLN